MIDITFFNVLNNEIWSVVGKRYFSNIKIKNGNFNVKLYFAYPEFIVLNNKIMNNEITTTGGRDETK